MPSTHRKRLKTYNIPGHAHELTFSCFHRQPLLTKSRTCRWLVDAMEAARTEQGLCLWAYVIMPEHVHILFWPKEAVYDIARIRTALKAPVTRKALKHLRENAPVFLEKLADRRPDGTIHYRFWQRGGGYDRNVIEPGTLEVMIEYIHNNPVRRGLVMKATDWVWSSARFWSGDFNVPIRMDALPTLY